MSNKFLYEVRPVKPVVTPDGRAKRRPFSSLLSKEEVMEYMKSANIYRRFVDATEPIKVTGETLDSLHREKFNIVVETICKVNEPKLEYINTPESLETELEEEIPAISEAINVKYPVVEEDETEEQVVEDTTIDALEETVEEEYAEEVEDKIEESEIDVVEETKVEATKQQTRPNNGKNTIQMNHGYHNKKKHNR